MSYYLWIAINIIFIGVVMTYTWSIQGNYSSIILIGQLFAQIAVLFFAINLNVFFIIQVIKKAQKKKVKISLAKLLRKLMKYHVRIASIGSIFIIIHATIMLYHVGNSIGYIHPKFLSGYIAIFALSINLFAGYLRHNRASGIRRKFHLYMAFIFALFFSVHLFIPL